MIEIKPCTVHDIESFYGCRPERSVKAFSIFREGELVAIAGVSITPDCVEAFSDIKPGVTAPKMTIWKTAKRLAELIYGFGLPVIAITGNGKFLETLGFSLVRDIEDKKIYKL